MGDYDDWNTGDFAIKLAASIMALAEDRDEWRHRAIRAEKEEKFYRDTTMNSIREQEKAFGEMFVGLLDPNNGLARMVRAVERDPLKGKVES